MRPLERFLLLTDLLALLVVSIPRLRVGRWTRHLPALTMPVAAAQYLVEGPRWQMIMAYLLAVSITVVWMRQRVTPVHRADTGNWSRYRVAHVARALGVLLLAIAAALPIALPVFRFPDPAGPYAIGTVTYHLVDTSRAEAFGPDSSQRRQLMVQVWYPALPTVSAHRAAYIPDANIVTTAFAHVQRKRALLFTQLKYVTTHAVLAIPVAVDQPRWPVLIFVEGATGFRQMNTFQVEHLVSNGYIVVAIDQPGAAAVVVFPDGHQAVGLTVPQFHEMVRPAYMPVSGDGLRDRVLLPNGTMLHDNSIVPYLAQDVSFTLNQLGALDSADPTGTLVGKLDLQRVGAFGVSLGGIVVGESCRRDDRLRACLVLDAPMSTAVVASGLRQPAMWITRDAASMRFEREHAGGWPEAEIEAHQASVRAAYNGLKGAGYVVRMLGMFHSNFTDIAIWTPLARHLAIAGPINADRAHDIVNAYSLAFFNKHVLGRPSTLLSGAATRFPEVRFESRRP